MTKVVRSNQLANGLLDKLIILWVMPPVGFLISLLQIPELRYVTSNHVILVVLLVASAFRLQTHPVSRRTLALILLSSTLTVTFLCIEWLHYLAGRKTIDGLTDLRMVIYSPFYGSIMIFVLYAVYLTSLDGGQRRTHLVFVIQLLSWFHIIFLGYWLLLYFGWAEPMPKSDLLHSNSISYEALFVLCVMLFYRDAIDLNALAFRAFIIVNTAVIFLNQTRGAIIGLVFVGCYLLVKSAGDVRRTMLVWGLLGSLFGVVVLAAFMGDGVMDQVLGKDAGYLGAVLNDVSGAYESGESFVSASPAAVRDESSLSAFSRIGSNYYSFLSFIDNPLLGIGQAESYSINVFGSGVHSMHFLMANSTGILGLVLFFWVVTTIMIAQNSTGFSGRYATMLLLFFGYVLVFINSMPVYFPLILTLLASQREGKHRRVLSMPPQSGEGGRPITIKVG